MAWYDFFTSKKVKQSQVEVKRLQSFNFQNNIQRLTPLYPSWESIGFEKIYKTIDDIYSITNKIASKTASIEFYAYIEKADEDVKKFNKIRTHLPKKVNEIIRQKALQDVSENDIVYDLINSPSINFSKIEFYKAIALFILLHGEAIIYKGRLTDGVNAGKYRNFEILYPQFVSINVSDGFPKYAVSYEYTIGGKKVFTADAKDIIHIKYFNPGLDSYGTDLRGLSPLKIAANRITRLKANMDVSVAQLQNGGVNNIVWDKDTSDAAKEIIDARKDNFFKFIGNKANKGAPFFASGEMGNIVLGSNLTDMEVAALADIDFDKLCNIWGASSTMFNSKNAQTESNVKEQRKAFYTDACLPLLKMILDAFEKDIREDFGKPYILQPDLQSIQELQEDTKKIAETMAQSPVMIPKYTLEALGLPYNENDESLSKVYIKNGYDRLEDLQGVADIPID